MKDSRVIMAEIVKQMFNIFMENYTFDDKIMKLSTMIEHVILKIFSYRTISDLSPETNGSWPAGSPNPP